MGPIGILTACKLPRPQIFAIVALSGLPSNAKTSADYMEGIFAVEAPSMAGPTPGAPSSSSASSASAASRRRRHRKNVSPAVLKNRIEVLQHENKK